MLFFIEFEYLGLSVTENVSIMMKLVRLCQFL